MKFGRLKNITRKKKFFKNHAENEAEGLVPDLRFVLKILYEVKASVLQLSSNFTKLYKTVSNFRLLIQRYAQFWFFRKGSGNRFSTKFCV